VTEGLDDGVHLKHGLGPLDVLEVQRLRGEPFGDALQRRWTKAFCG
jgi:hypothetical protein